MSITRYEYYAYVHGNFNLCSIINDRFWEKSHYNSHQQGTYLRFMNIIKIMRTSSIIPVSEPSMMTIRSLEAAATTAAGVITAAVVLGCWVMGVGIVVVGRGSSLTMIHTLVSRGGSPLSLTLTNK